jgi:transposase
MGRALKVSWEESAEELYELYKGERDTERRKRLHALWLLRSGRPPAVAAELAGVGKRTVERWLSWYRRGGLKEVLKRVPGHGAPGSACRLGGEQLEELVVRAGEGQFRTYSEARDWVEEEWGVSYEYKGMYALLARLSVRPKVPRPAAQKADPDAQEAWKKGD